MMPNTLNIPANKMALYKATARRQAAQKALARQARHTRAWQVAHEACRVLKEEFGAQQVFAFGSLLQPNRFDERSDVDLAVRGLDERIFYRAVARLLDIEPDIPVDVVELEFARPTMLANILREGMELCTSTEHR